MTSVDSEDTGWRVGRLRSKEERELMAEKTSNNKGAAVSRRAFLKAVGMGGAACALPGGVSAATEEHQTAQHELATLLDLSRCIGCGACVQACKESNEAKFPEPQKPFPTMYPEAKVKVEDWSEKRHVDDRLTPYNWLYIQSATVEHAGRSVEVHVPRRCMHCVNPPCANLCPFGAAQRHRDGTVRINDDICLGGAKCKSVCPWKIPQRQTGVGLYLDLMPGYAGNGVMYKCDRCHQRLARGELPACIEACPMDVQQIGPRDEIVAKAHALAEEMRGFVYGEQENGGTNTIYVSPVPFALLNAKVEKGEGKPHLAPVENKMARAENLTWALVMGPLAGIGAGLLSVAGSLKKKAGRGGDDA
jgi:formate dehydrogenase iron-sulfur subunit